MHSVTLICQCDHVSFVHFSFLYSLQVFVFIARYEESCVSVFRAFYALRLGLKIFAFGREGFQIQSICRNT